jgi:hypothetical protein
VAPDLHAGKNRVDKLVVYTVLTGDKEKLGNPVCKLLSSYSDLHIDFICLTDNADLKSDIWKCQTFSTNGLQPEKSSRRPKALPHEYFKDYRYSLYLDNICELKRLPNSHDLIHSPNSRYVFRLFKHSTRKTLIEEAHAIATLGYETAENLIRQLFSYSRLVPLNDVSPLSTCTVLLREHMHPSIVRHGQLWWEHILNFSKRDQMSFDFTRVLVGAEVIYLPGDKFANDLIYEHANHSSNRRLANLDQLKLEIYREMLRNRTKEHETRVTISESEYALVPSSELELLTFLTSSTLGHYDISGRHLTTDLQSLLSTYKNQVEVFIGIFKKSNEKQSFDRVDFLSSQNALSLFLRPSSQRYFDFDSVDELVSMLASTSRSGKVLVCLYNFNSTIELKRLLQHYDGPTLTADVLLIPPQKVSQVSVESIVLNDFHSVTKPAEHRDIIVRDRTVARYDYSNIIYCDGGLANRVYTVIFGLILRKRYGHRWRLSWPKTCVCDAAFEKLFEASLDVDRKLITEFKEHESSLIKIVHHNFGEFSTDKLFFHSQLKSYEEYRVLLDSGNVFYFHNSLPSFVELSDISDVIRDIDLAAPVSWRASDFISRFKITKETIGLHVRKTDFGSRVNEEKLYELAARSDKKFFVCSDDQEILSMFKTLPNCIISESSYFPEKLNHLKAWGETYVDSKTGIQEYNINRSEQSVIDGLVDLIILSNTSIVETSKSSFLQLAAIFGKLNFGQKSRGR